MNSSIVFVCNTLLKSHSNRPCSHALRFGLKYYGCSVFNGRLVLTPNIFKRRNFGIQYSCAFFSTDNDYKHKWKKPPVIRELPGVNNIPKTKPIDYGLNYQPSKLRTKTESITSQAQRIGEKSFVNNGFSGIDGYSVRKRSPSQSNGTRIGNSASNNGRMHCQDKMPFGGSKPKGNKFSDRYVPNIREKLEQRTKWKNAFHGKTRPGAHTRGKPLTRDEEEFHNVLRRKLFELVRKNKLMNRDALLRRIESHRSRISRASLLTLWQIVSRLDGNAGMVDPLIQRLMEITVEMAHKRRLDPACIVCVFKASYFMKLPLEQEIVTPLLKNMMYRLSKFKLRDHNSALHFIVLLEMEVPEQLKSFFIYHITKKICYAESADIISTIILNMGRNKIAPSTELLASAKPPILSFSWKPRFIRSFLDGLANAGVNQVDHDIAKLFVRQLSDQKPESEFSKGLIIRISRIEKTRWTAQKLNESDTGNSSEEDEVWVEEHDESDIKGVPQMDTQDLQHKNTNIFESSIDAVIDESGLSRSDVGIYEMDSKQEICEDDRSSAYDIVDDSICTDYVRSSTDVNIGSTLDNSSSLVDNENTTDVLKLNYSVHEK